MNDDTGRLKTIRRLLETALDGEEEYLYQGEMSEYKRLSADDAIAELDFLFRKSPPTLAEIDFCVEALSVPERVRSGRSKRFLIRLGDRSRPFLEAFSRSQEPRLRIFALETGGVSVAGSKLYGGVEMERRLLEDANEDVRLAAVESVRWTLSQNLDYLNRALENESENPIVELFRRFLTLLKDTSPKVRAAIAEAIESFTSQAGREVLNGIIERAKDAKNL